MPTPIRRLLPVVLALVAIRAPAREQSVFVVGTAGTREETILGPESSLILGPLEGGPPGAVSFEPDLEAIRSIEIAGWSMNIVARSGETVRGAYDGRIQRRHNGEWNELPWSEYSRVEFPGEKPSEPEVSGIVARFLGPGLDGMTLHDLSIEPTWLEKIGSHRVGRHATQSANYSKRGESTDVLPFSVRPGAAVTEEWDVPIDWIREIVLGPAQVLLRAAAPGEDVFELAGLLGSQVRREKGAVSFRGRDARGAWTFDSTLMQAELDRRARTESSARVTLRIELSAGKTRILESSEDLPIGTAETPRQEFDVYGVDLQPIRLKIGDSWEKFEPSELVLLEVLAPPGQEPAGSPEWRMATATFAGGEVRTGLLYPEFGTVMARGPGDLEVHHSAWTLLKLDLRAGRETAK